MERDGHHVTRAYCRAQPRSLALLNGRCRSTGLVSPTGSGAGRAAPRKAGFGAARHVELGVDVLDVGAGGLRRDHESRRDLLVGAAPRDEAEHLDLAGGSVLPDRRRAAPTRWPAAPSTASTASPSSRPAVTSRAELVRRLVAASVPGGGAEARASPGTRRPRPASAPARVIAAPTAPAGTRSRRAAHEAAPRPGRAAASDGDCCSIRSVR